MKKVGIVGAGVISIGLLLGACSEEAVQVDEKKVVEESKPVAPPKEEKEVAPKEDLTDKSVDEAIMLKKLKENFIEVGDVTFDEESKVFTVHPEDPQVAVELAEMLDGTRSKESWYNLVESFTGLSERIGRKLGPGYGLAMANPVNEENVILIITDGLVIYDVFEK